MGNKNKGKSLENNNLEELLNKKSFKIKPIFLELKNYTFYHSAINEEDKDCNDRFVGRQKLIDKIRSFIYESTVNTGSYLITGYRGMGKTSLINKALSELNPKSKTLVFFYLWLFLLPTIFIEKKNFFNKYMLLIPLVTIFIYVIMIYHNSSFIGENDKCKDVNKRSKLEKFFSKVTDVFENWINPDLQREKYTFVNNFRYFTLYLIALSFLIFLYNCFEFLDENKNFHKFWTLNISLFVIYLLKEVIKEIRLSKKNIGYIVLGGVLVVSVILLYIDFHKGIVAVILVLFLLIFKLILKISYIKKTPKNYLTAFSRLQALVDFKQFLVIKINLGKDDLSEKDVLKYITNEIYKSYSSWFSNFTNFKRFFSVFSLSLLLLLLINGVYNLVDKEYSYKQINDTYSLSKFFPSQILIPYNKDSTNFSLAVEDDSIKNLYLPKVNSKSLGIKSNEEKRILERYKNKIGFESIKHESFDTIYYKKTNSIINYDKFKIEKHQSLLNKSLYNVGKVTNLVDYLFLTSYRKVRNVFFGPDVTDVAQKVAEKKEKKEKKVSNGFYTWFRTLIDYLFPENPPLLVFLTFFIALFLYKSLPIRVLPFKSHTSALRELKELKKQIEASITREKNLDSTISSRTLFSIRKTETYAPLEEKDISQRLISILETVDNIKPIFTKIKFIIVFDELDKISSHYNETLSEKEENYGESGSLGYQAKRKERVYKILSSMKHFLNTAKLKSIFIAGRDMYDASLAGVSDRDSNLDSIFNNNKLYVESFYSEGSDRNLSDLTSMTEQYICKFLIPSDYLKGKSKRIASLKIYKEYLEDTFVTDEQAVAVLKTIASLKDFIKYIAYRSNGAPRKISTILEQYIQPYTKKALNDHNNKIIFAENNQSLCLKFSYYDQYKFSYISYLVTPVFLGIGNYVVEYSDKLLVSISYMLDHLFKHHKFGLSYRTLSLTPELLDVNKEPEFRNFLDKLIGFLSKNHLRKIVSGIYDFKFHSKITSELKYLSKIDDIEAAAFNFTKDESVELKKHFRKKLSILEKRYNEGNFTVNVVDNSRQEYKNAISLLYMSLGDLYFNDEEFGEAIEHYLEAIQILRQSNIQDMHIYDFVVFVRNKLKLGLAFEKNKNFDSAKMTYAELTNLILRKRNIPIRKLGLCRFYVKKDEITGFEKDISNDENYKKVFAKNENEDKNWYTKYKDRNSEMLIVGRPTPKVLLQLNSDEDWKKVRPYTDMEVFYDFDGDFIASNFNDIAANYKPLKRNYEFTTYENIRILYQPIIAKLHLIEKSSPNKLKDIDIVRAIKEFKFFKLPLRSNEKRVIVAEFYNKLGDLLYFKNGTLNSCIKNILIEDGEIEDDEKEKVSRKYNKNQTTRPIDATLFYIKSLAILLIPLEQCKDSKKDSKKDFNKINLLNYYEFKDINDLKFSDFKTNIEKTLSSIDENLKTLKESNNYLKKYSSDYLTSVANGLVDLGGSLLSFTNEKDFIFGQKERLLYCIKLFYQANLIFKRLGEFRLAKSQLIKILHILYEKDTEINLDKIEDKDLKIECIINTCIKYIYRSYNQANRPEIKKMRDILNIKDKYSEVYKSTTIMAEINEVINLYWLLYFKVAKGYNSNVSDLTVEKAKEVSESDKTMFTEVPKILDVLNYSYTNTTPYSQMSNKYNRVLELSLRLKVNKWIWKKINENWRYSKLFMKIFFDNNKCSKGDFNAEKRKCLVIKQFLIIDSIGVCNEIIKTHNMFEVNYITTNNLALAKAHKEMGFWCALLNSQDTSEQDIIKKELVLMLNSKNLMYLSHFYHYELSMQYNYKVISFHNRGEALKEFLLNATYLDDFYNDNLIHFSITVERNSLNEGEVARGIGENNDSGLRNLISGSEALRQENYYKN